MGYKLDTPVLDFLREGVLPGATNVQDYRRIRTRARGLKPHVRQ